MRTHPIKNFKYGIVNNIESYSIPDGAFASNKNWITLGDKVELRKGYTLFGSDDTGSYKAYTHVGTTANGTDVLFKKVGAKLYYYNTTTEAWVEIGTNLFTGAETDIPSFANYSSNAGDFVYISSPNSELYKITTATPTSYTALYSDGTNYKGYIKIFRNRMYLWGRRSDQTGIYLSNIDTSNYTTVSDENVGTGDGTQVTFADTLAFRAGSALRTCFAIEVTDGTETFTDNYDGTLTGSAGGTGTINYTTGAISVTFAAAPNNTQAITCTYQWENSNDGGITDFTYSTPRTAGEGLIIRQDSSGGIIKNIVSYNDEEYVFHKYAVWKISFGDDDTTTYNRVWRENVGIDSMHSACSTGDGIYYIDLTNGPKPVFRIMSLDVIAQEVIPRPVTQNIDLTDYLFDYSAVKEYGEYIMISCRTNNSSFNNTLLIYNKEWNSIDIADFTIETMDIYNTDLIASSSTNGDVMKLFDNRVDNLDYSFDNYIIGNTSELGAERLKKVKKIVVEGDISPDQYFDVYVSTDDVDWIKLGTVEGNGSYVDFASSHGVYGSDLLGEYTIGGAATDEPIYHYKVVLACRTAKFNKIQYKIVARGIGYVSVSMFQYWDIRAKTYKVPSKYR